MLSSADMRVLCGWYAEETLIHSVLTGSQKRLIESGKGRTEVNHICSPKREKCLDISFGDAYSQAYLFQDSLPLRRLVSKTTQEELRQLDCEVGEEGEVSHNIRGNTLWN